MNIRYHGAKAPAVKLTSKKHISQLEKHLISMDISRTMGQVSELSVIVDDPNYALLRTIGEPLGAAVATMGLNYIVDSFDMDAGGGQGGMTLNCRPKSVRDLKNRRGALVMNRVSPTTFVQREVQAVGGRFVGQPSAVRSRVARDVESNTDDEKPSSWTTIRRLSEELGYSYYEDGNVFYFGKPTWLVNNIGRIRINYNDPVRSNRPTTLPKMSASLDEPDGAEYSLSMGIEHAIDMKPGMRVDLTGFPTRNTAYLLSSIDHPIYGSSGDVSMTLKKPVDPEVTTTTGT